MCDQIVILYLYVRSNCWYIYTLCLPAGPLRLHKSVLKGISRYTFDLYTDNYVLAKSMHACMHTSTLLCIFGRHYRWPDRQTHTADQLYMYSFLLSILHAYLLGNYLR